MRWLSLLLLIAACFPSKLLADSPPSTQPAVGVLLLPFTPIGAPAVPPWVARGVQDSLLSDLARNPLFQPAAADNLAQDNDQALALARRVGARWVIFGTYQAVDDQLRFSGIVLDVATSHVLSGISATGPLRDLFTTEDTLTAQARRSLAQALQPAQSIPSAQAPTALSQPIATPAVATVPFVGSSLQSSLQKPYWPTATYWQDQAQGGYDRNTYWNSLGFYGYGYGWNSWNSWGGYPYSYSPFSYGGYGYGGYPYHGYRGPGVAPLPH